MDTLYVREAGENYWALPFGKTVNLAELTFAGPVAVVGKGPDLDLLRAHHLAGFHAVICVNESVHVVERLWPEPAVFAIQTDTVLGRSCLPQRGRLLVSLCAAHKYRRVDGKIVFRLNDYPIARVCTGGYAVAIARSRGATSFTMFAFNASVDGDRRHASVLGTRPRSTVDWHRQRRVIEEAAAGVPVHWRRLVLDREPQAVFARGVEP